MGSKYAIKNNQLFTDELVPLDAAGSPISGILDANWVKRLYDPSGSEVSVARGVTVTEIGATGYYRVTWTPNALGSWLLTLENVANQVFKTASYDCFTNNIDNLTTSTCVIAATAVVGAGSTTTEVRTNLTQANGFWNNMVMVVENTGGTGERVARNIDQYLNANGALTTHVGLPWTPQAGDNVSILARTGSLRDDNSPVTF